MDDLDKEKTLKARVRIGARHGSGETRFYIHIIDETSRTHACEVELTPENFALALANTEVEAEVSWAGLSKLGWVHQNKEERGVTKENLHEFEVDGWVSRQGDLGNSHRRAQDGSYTVVFFRHVPPEK